MQNITILLPFIICYIYQLSLQYLPNNMRYIYNAILPILRDLGASSLLNIKNRCSAVFVSLSFELYLYDHSL